MTNFHIIYINKIFNHDYLLLRREKCCHVKIIIYWFILHLVIFYINNNKKKEKNVCTNKIKVISRFKKNNFFLISVKFINL